MLRTILKPTKKNLTIKLPDNLVGKLVEVIAFEIEETVNPEREKLEKIERVRSIAKGLDKYRSNLTNFTFDRLEANDYE